MTPYLFALMSVAFLWPLYLSLRELFAHPSWWRESPRGSRIADTVLSWVFVLCLIVVAALFAWMAYSEWRHQ